MLYNRQASLNLRIPKHAIIVGAGGIGAWTAILSAMTGTPRIDIYDDDNIEETNLARLPFTAEAVGRLKVEVVAEYINSIRPSCTIMVHNTRIHKDNLHLLNCSANIVYSCGDDVVSDVLLKTFAEECGMAYKRGAYDGLTISVSSQNPLTTSAEEVTNPGYRVIPSFAIPAVMVATLMVLSVTGGKNLEILGEATKLVSKELPMQRRMQSTFKEVEKTILQSIREGEYNDYGYCSGECHNECYTEEHVNDRICQAMESVKDRLETFMIMFLQDNMVAKQELIRLVNNLI